MGNVQLSARYQGNYIGTILAGGTLSAEIDLTSFPKIGAIYHGMVNCTLTVQVSHIADADGGTYVDLLGSNGAALVLCGPTGANGAISGVVLEPLAPYRFCKIKSSVTQTGGVVLYLPVKM